jgi:hypothetical protein
MTAHMYNVYTLIDFCTLHLCVKIKMIDLKMVNVERCRISIQAARASRISILCQQVSSRTLEAGGRKGAMRFGQQAE